MITCHIRYILSRMSKIKCFWENDWTLNMLDDQIDDLSYKPHSCFSLVQYFTRIITAHLGSTHWETDLFPQMFLTELVSI